jgi:DNA-directed RNA polymerase subunit RPC12/RpoP
MRTTRFIYAARVSWCCGERALLVRSRDGGFVSRNCLKCGQSAYAAETDLPVVTCDACDSRLVVKKSDGKNYFYVCESCSRQWKLAEVLPHWSELFEYSGLAVDSDMSPSPLRSEHEEHERRRL